jgi:mono/diheme cytochrome c family protein
LDGEGLMFAGAAMRVHALVALDSRYFLSFLMNKIAQAVRMICLEFSRRMLCMKSAWFLGLTLVLACAAGSCRRNPAAAPVDFVTQIKPLIQAQCINCHHSGALFGNLNLESRELAFRGTAAGPPIVPRDPEKSRLYTVLTLPESERKAMPPTGHRILQKDVELLKQWILEGAKWPEGPEGLIKPVVTDKPPGGVST